MSPMSSMSKKSKISQDSKLYLKSTLLKFNNHCKQAAHMPCLAQVAIVTWFACVDPGTERKRRLFLNEINLMSDWWQIWNTATKTDVVRRLFMLDICGKYLDWFSAWFVFYSTANMDALSITTCGTFLRIQTNHNPYWLQIPYSLVYFVQHLNFECGDILPSLRV